MVQQREVTQSFSQRLLTWWAEHGRHHLPWQQERTPYRVWLSEVMLQQTQVSTVIPYFSRFTEKFPELTDLAAASEDDVLALWSGLGYYSRGRNLHKAAQLCVEQHAGELPTDPEILETLPGIGRSTANAIIAQAHDQVLPILDGNVKRVMARHAGIAGWPGQSAVATKLWQAATERLPGSRGADYTQAIMDLGATLCTSRRPSCELCPVHNDCYARNANKQDELPGRKPKKQIPLKTGHFLLLSDADGKIWLQKRPAQGIWASLWCLPQFESEKDAQQWLQQQGHNETKPDNQLSFQHVFTHFKLSAAVHCFKIRQAQQLTNQYQVNEASHSWLSLTEALEKGLPQPIRNVLETIHTPDLLTQRLQTDQKRP